MKSVKEKKKLSGSIKIDSEVLQAARVVCAIKKINIQDYATDVIDKANKKHSK